MLPANPANRILQALSPREYQALRRDLIDVSFGVGEVLIEEDQPITTIYFLNSGVVSLMAALEGGATVEVAFVGRDGIVGVTGTGEIDHSPWRAIAQNSGEAVAMTAAAFHCHWARLPGLRELVTNYMGFLLMESAQLTACSHFHTVTQRSARWLLQVQNQTGQSEHAITQDRLSRILGVQRPTVTTTIRHLEDAAVVQRTGRGRFRVIDQPGLEATACECYGRIRSWRERLFARTPRRAPPHRCTGPKLHPRCSNAL